MTDEQLAEFQRHATARAALQWDPVELALIDQIAAAKAIAKKVAPVARAAIRVARNAIAERELASRQYEDGVGGPRSIVDTMLALFSRSTLPRLSFSSEKYHREYLQSDRWKQLRRRAFQRAGGYCARCHRHETEMRRIEIIDPERGTVESGATLNVHHLTYDRLGHEREDDLIVLCRECHLREHGRIKSGEIGDRLLVVDNG